MPVCECVHLQEQTELLQCDGVTRGVTLETAHYLINKLITMTVNQATLAAQRQAAISELEGKMKQVRSSLVYCYTIPFFALVGKCTHSLT